MLAIFTPLAFVVGIFAIKMKRDLDRLEDSHTRPAE